MQYQANAVLNALDEGAVSAVVRLYETGIIDSNPAKTKRQNIFKTLTEKSRGLGMEQETANYWLDFIGIQ